MNLVNLIIVKTVYHNICTPAYIYVYVYTFSSCSSQNIVYRKLGTCIDNKSYNVTIYVFIVVTMDVYIRLTE